MDAMKPAVDSGRKAQPNDDAWWNRAGFVTCPDHGQYWSEDGCAGCMADLPHDVEMSFPVKTRDGRTVMGNVAPATMADVENFRRQVANTALIAADFVAQGAELFTAIGLAAHVVALADANMTTAKPKTPAQVAKILEVKEIAGSRKGSRVAVAVVIQAGEKKISVTRHLYWINTKYGAKAWSGKPIVECDLPVGWTAPQQRIHNGTFVQYGGIEVPKK